MERGKGDEGLDSGDDGDYVPGKEEFADTMYTVWYALEDNDLELDDNNNADEYDKRWEGKEGYNSDGLEQESSSMMMTIITTMQG